MTMRREGAGYRPSEDEPYMNPRQLDYFRELLQQWQRRLRREDQDTLAVLQRQNGSPADPVDRGVEEASRHFELSSRIRRRQLLAMVEAALDRIEDGSYGFCLRTGEAIGIRRLEALPFAPLSVESQEARERYRRLYPCGSPADEESLCA